MIEVYLLVWALVVFIIVFLLMYYAFHALDLSKIFKANSTTQIKVIQVFISAAVAFSVALGIIDILKLIVDVF